LGPLASLTRVDACNLPTASAPNLGAGRTRRPRDFHLSHARLRPPRLSPLRARPHARPIWAGARSTLTRRLRDPPVSKRRHSASRIFIMQPGCTPPPAVTQYGDLQLDGGGKRAGLRPLPLPQPQGFSSSRPRWRMRRVGGLPLRGSVTLFFPWRLGENGILQLRGDFLQPCRDRWAAATQPGRSTTPSVRTTVAPCTARAAPTLWAVLARAKTCRRASRRRQPEMASLPMRLPTPPVALGLRLPA
jgi:hypothetical protein